MDAPKHSRLDAAHASGAMLVEQCDVPVGMTLDQWRAAESAGRRAARRPSLRKRLFARRPRAASGETRAE